MIQFKFALLTSAIALFSNAAFSACDSDMPRNKPDAMYKDYGDGTVMDTKTRLIWQKCSMGQTYSGGTCAGTPTSYSWEQAMAAAQTANLANMYGHGDWRVPNAKELFSLMDMACYKPAINEVIFPNSAKEGFYWTSTPAPSSSTQRLTYIINASSGFYGGNPRNASTILLWLVRN